MNKIFKHKILAGAMLCGIMLAGVSCEDNEITTVSPETPFADKTLYEIIKNDPDLTNFLAVLDACGEQCADSLFNQSRVYTVWAPKNDAINKDSLIQEINDGNRDVVFRSFIEAHIANFLVPANGTLEDDNTILLLNDKNAIFVGDNKSGYTFSGVPLDRNNTNIRALNGILHKIERPSEYKHSIWEYLRLAENVDSVAQYLYSFDVTEFSSGLSTMGPIIDGEQTYIDSVFTTTNIWLETSGVGKINNEDSTYTVYVPSNKMWAEVIAKAEKHYNYDLGFANMTMATKIERDSLRRYYARKNNLKYMSYSANEQKYVQSSDSAMPAYRNDKRRRQFAIADIEEHVIFEKELSNGMFKVVDEMPYKQTDLWHDTIFLEGENSAMWYYGDEVPVEVEVLNAYEAQINRDSLLTDAKISGGSYFSFTRESKAATAYFKIPKVLSAKYNVALIVVPRHITNKFIKDEELYPNKFTIKLQQSPSKGAAIKLYEATRSNPLFTNPFKVDTLFLTTDGVRAVIEPTYCEFYDGKATDYNVTLEITSVAATNAEKKEGIYYDTSIRVDKIMLIPVLDAEE